MRLSLFAISLGLVVTMFAPAQAASPLTPATVTVTRHEGFKNFDPDVGLPCCAGQVFLSGPEVDFLYLDIDFDIAWSDDLDSISYTSRDIVLVLPGVEEPIEACGRVAFMPVVEVSGAAMRARRPGGWPDETAGAYLNTVFAIPAGTKTATLLVGEGDDQLSLPIEVPAEATELPPVSDYMSLSATGLSRVDGFETSERRGSFTLGGLFEASVGQILGLDVSMTPVANADTDIGPGKNAIVFYNTAVALMGPDGLPLVPLGQDVSGGISNNLSNSSRWEDEPRSSNSRVYFLGSGAAGAYEVMFFDQQVGTVSLP
jgi:hypothetical protein